MTIDVQYEKTRASIGLVLFEDWTQSAPTNTRHLTLANPKPYEPGQFYKRELPCILAALEALSEHPTTIIVDGHVFLDGQARPGLGKHLFDAIEERASVIGVAKTAFAGIDPACELLRGTSKRPLYVSAVGMTLEAAKTQILSMHGPNRMPTLLKLADRIARDGRAEPPTNS